MENILSGKAWKFGDNVDTDIIMPSQYLSWDIEKSYRRAFEPLRKDFGQRVQPNDVIVAGFNFGCGSSREQAAQAILRLGIRIVIAKLFSRIFYRNALNIGLYPIESKDAFDLIGEGDVVAVDLAAGTIRNLATDETAFYSPFPDNLKGIIAARGLVNYMKQFNERRGPHS